jgi:hypothetical protein
MEGYAKLRHCPEPGFPQRPRHEKEFAMSEIHVVYPKEGDPIVCQPAQVASRREPITWRFYSDNPEVQSVTVEFADAEFFQGTPTPMSLHRPLSSGQADFYGHVPVYGALSSPKIAKYSIRAYADPAGKSEIQDLFIDPVIITPQP